VKRVTVEQIKVDLLNIDTLLCYYWHNRAFLSLLEDIKFKSVHLALRSAYDPVVFITG